LPAATLAFHLRQLKHAGLVRFTRDGRSLISAAVYPTMTGLIAHLGAASLCGEAAAIAESDAPQCCGEALATARPNAESRGGDGTTESSTPPVVAALAGCCGRRGM